jgi:hypothetical protein
MDEKVDPVVEKLAVSQRLHNEHKMMLSFEALVDAVMTLNRKVNQLPANPDNQLGRIGDALWSISESLDRKHE